MDISKVKERLWSFWDNLLKRVDEEGTKGYSREKIVVFVIALILALCMWFLVNLSRDYVLNVNLPIDLGNMPDEMALARDLPDFATVSVQGEGWKLLNLYNNPPRIFVDVTNSQINLYDQVQQQMNAMPDIDVQKVQPQTLSLDLEEKSSKRVPVRPRVRVDFEGQFDFVGEPVITPDSITITGASSLVGEISFWQTDSVTFSDVRSDISRSVSLELPPKLLTLSRSSVQYSAEVAQYTEGEARVFIRARNLPVGESITFSPSHVTVRYTVPIQEYAEVEDINPFSAVVPYNEIRRDSTGFVSPVIEVSAPEFHIKVESNQPERVSYFRVVDS